MKVAWLMNLDAELELEAPAEYARSSRMQARLDERGAELVAAFGRSFGVEAARLGDAAVDPSWTGQAWCPTASARAELESAGVAIDAPPPAILARVNHRAFAASLGQHLPGARFVTAMTELDAVVGESRPGGWLLKRPFGFAGRARKRVSGPPTGADRTWAEASMRGYGKGLQVEPFVDRELDVALHGVVTKSGDAAFGSIVVQHCDDHGTWLGQRAAEPGELTEFERDEMHRQARSAAGALATAGYFGPFSIDGFRWRAGDYLRFHPLSDLNARYTMGFFEAMAHRHEVLELIEASRR